MLCYKYDFVKKNKDKWNNIIKIYFSNKFIMSLLSSAKAKLHMANTNNISALVDL